MGSLSRRAVLHAAGILAGGTVVASCGAARRGGRRSPAGPLPIHDDNPPIDPARPVERGATLRVFQWRDYLSADVVEDFASRHATADVDVSIESFTTMAEAVERLRRPDGDFDVFFPTIDTLPGLVDERLLLPLSHELLRSIGNLWPFFLAPSGPFYDPGQRYSVPYTVYSTGIGWRRDLVRPTDAPDRLDQPYDAYWNPRYRGAVGIYDDYREAIALGLLRRGLDPNSEDAVEVASAVDDLIAMVDAVEVEVSAEGAYHELQTGEYAIQQSWSGDLLSAKRFGASAAAATREVAFTWPEGGIVGCDLTAICARGRNPVLAHAFVDHLLDVGVAFENFRWNGYQPPVGDERPPGVRASLGDALLGPEDLGDGRFLRPLAAAADARWRVGWQRFLGALT
ncbi:MAG TPA: extracellular solute-binding protein [Actinomycetota bacterium]|nr:extracellular solute-binding protein [Actinomycetota bacterium]